MVRVELPAMEPINSRLVPVVTEKQTISPTTSKRFSSRSQPDIAC
jgi:hypothetical protein